MSSKQKLKSALRAIDDARANLKRARDSTNDDHEIRKAISALDDAESDIKKAIRELPDQ